MASTITQYIGAQQAYSANRTAANENYANKMNADQAQNTQLSEQLSEDHVSNAIRSAQTYGRIAATSTGLGAASLMPALGAATMNVARSQSIEDMNTASKRQNIVASMTGAELERRSQINSMAKPNLVTLGLGLAKDATGGATSFGQMGGKFPMNPTTGNPDVGLN